MLYLCASLIGRLFALVNCFHNRDDANIDISEDILEREMVWVLSLVSIHVHRKTRHGK